MKIKKILVLLAASFILCTTSYGQSEDIPETEEIIQTEDSADNDKLLFVFSYGVTGAHVTRIQKQTGRSNFVFEHMLAGLYFAATTKNLGPFDTTAKLSVYYPLISTFNEVPQVSKQVILYGFDLTIAPMYQINLWNFMNLDLGLGLHALYQLTDAWHYVSVGIAPVAEFEFPITSRWTVLLDGTFSWDYGNFGSNSKMSPLDFTFEYQASLGARYSKKSENKFYYIKKKNK